MAAQPMLRGKSHAARGAITLDMVIPAYISVLDNDGDIAPADLGDIGTVAVPALDHADGIAVTVLSGDRRMSGAELSDADNVMATALIGVSKVVKAILTNDASV